MIRTLLMLSVCLIASGTALAQATKAKDATRKIQAVFEPAQAKPGQTVTFKDFTDSDMRPIEAAMLPSVTSPSHSTSNGAS